MDRDAGVAWDRLGTGRRDGQKGAGAFGDLDAEMVERPRLGLHDDLLVGKGRARDGAPVDHAFAAVDGALLEEVDEHGLNAGGVLGIHGEAFPAPVAGGTQFLELLDDDAPVLFFPLPDFFEEGVPAQVVAVFDDTLLFQGALHHCLGGDARVVGAGQPEHFLSQHACASGEDVLDGIVEDVPEGQHPGDVRRWDDNGVGRALRGDAFGVGGKAALLQPAGIPRFFNGLGFVGLWELGHKKKGDCPFPAGQWQALPRAEAGFPVRVSRGRAGWRSPKQSPERSAGLCRGGPAAGRGFPGAGAGAAAPVLPDPGAGVGLR